MNSLNLSFAGVQYDEIVNGEDLGMTIYFQGCSHHCPGCHNPETWEFGKGKYARYEICQKINEYFSKTPFAKRLTFSGGDPLDNTYDLYPILLYMQEFYPNIKLWLYTGCIYENLEEDKKAMCDMVDVIVDGPFIQELRDVSLSFRGSTNQKIIRNDKSRN